MAVEFAPAKVNLTLHVTGQRPNGYHELDSLVVFVGCGDVLSSEPAAQMGLSLAGPFGPLLPGGEDNLVCRAARLVAGRQNYHFNLVKNLPPASGIGGGSSDAAAAIRAVLGRNWHQSIGLYDKALELGADVPVCLAAQPVRMSGIGEYLTPVPTLPQAWLVLVNPRVEVATPKVFAALKDRQQPAMPMHFPHWPDLAAFVQWLAEQRNDLEAPALTLAPVIGEVRAAILAQEECLLARMSGSGATCFGVFATQKAAETAASRIQSLAPQWWVAAAEILPA